MIFRVSIQTALVFCSLLFWLLLAEYTLAQESVDLTPDYCASLDADNQYLKQLNADLQSDLSFTESFEKIKKTYHDHVITHYQTALDRLEKQFSVDENKQCGATRLFTQINRPVLWKSIATEFQKYDCALELVQRTPSLFGQEATLLQGVHTLSTVQNMLQNERIAAKTALFQSEELYGYYFDYYPVHLDFLCMIYEVKEYNQALWKWVDTIVLIPSKFYNYGSTHQ